MEHYSSNLKKQVQLIPNEKFSGCHRDISYAMPIFSFEDIQKFLISLGYIPLVHEFIWYKDESHYGHYTGRKLKLLEEKVIAVKPDTIISNVWTEEVQESFEIINVFRRELKKKLLGF